MTHDRYDYPIERSERVPSPGLAAVLSVLKHIIDSPFRFDTKDYAGTKKNLVDYCRRLEQYIGGQETLRSS